MKFKNRLKRNTGKNNNPRSNGNAKAEINELMINAIGYTARNVNTLQINCPRMFLRISRLSNPRSGKPSNSIGNAAN